MMAEVREALEGCNLIFLIVDATRKFEQSDQFMLGMVKRSRTLAFLLMNKIDLLRGQRKRDGLDVLLEKTLAELPQGPRYFPEDQVTDQPARFMTAEIIREQILLATTEEVPYATTVVIEQFEEGAKLTRIAAVIYCEREGQKAILVGKRGQMLKKIGTAARLQIEKMLGTKVFLELFVKVRANWRESREFVDGLDWRRELERLVGNVKTAE